MKFYFMGSEVKLWRDLLESQNVPYVALSYIGLLRRNKNNAEITENWDLSSHYPDSQSIFLDSGAYTLNKEDSEYTREQAEELANNYMVFVSKNIDRISLVSEFDAQILGQEYIRAMREDFYDDLPPDKFMPIWHSEDGTEELEKLASSYSVVGITQTDLGEKSLVPTLNGLVNRYGVRLHGVAITGRKMMHQVKWDSVASLSWISPSRFGDTIIWTGNELKRYPKAYKDQARKQHRMYIKDNGFDADKIQADDSNEVLKLSIWSWGRFVEDLERHTVTNQPSLRNGENGPYTVEAVDNRGIDNRNELLLPAIPEQRETIMLPIMGTVFHDTDEEDGSTVRTPFIHTRSESMRACNTCFLREKCPGFKPDANCAYNIPIEIKTTEQMRALQSALIEMQGQRVLFMKMAEDLEGGYADPNLSSEMDRLQRMIKAKAEAEREGFSIHVEGSAPTGKGFMSSVFGSNVGEKLIALDAPISADEIIAQSEIVDAELVP